MKYKISVISGDGIGPEITKCSIDVIKSLEDKLNIEFELLEIEAGDSALKNNGIALSNKAIDKIKTTNACIKAPVGESAMEVIVRLRQLFDLYVNLRPAKSFPTVKSLDDNIDMLIVRENTEDLYKGQEFRIGDKAIALRTISEKASTRIAEYAFNIAKTRNNKVTAVHKSNVLKMTDGLFLECVNKIAQKNSNIEFSELCDKQLRIEGYVYVMINPAWEGWVKVGMAVDPSDRCSSFQTSSPHRDYEIYYSKKFKNKSQSETIAHDLLRQESTESCKEWFKLPKTKAVNIIKGLKL